jgi:hypothetical protein
LLLILTWHHKKVDCEISLIYKSLFLWSIVSCKQASLICWHFLLHLVDKQQTYFSFSLSLSLSLFSLSLFVVFYISPLSLSISPFLLIYLFLLLFFFKSLSSSPFFSLPNLPLSCYIHVWSDLTESPPTYTADLYYLVTKNNKRK